MDATTPSAERIRELLARNLQEVFGEADPLRRRAAIAELWAEDGTLHVPPGTIVGHAAIEAIAGKLRASHPDFVYTPHSQPQVLHDMGVLAWGSGRPGETPDYTGRDVLIAREGRIVALYVFLDETSEEFRGAIVSHP